VREGGEGGRGRGNDSEQAREGERKMKREGGRESERNKVGGKGRGGWERESSCARPHVGVDRRIRSFSMIEHTLSEMVTSRHLSNLGP
jgi:hypothetical protein